ncbi:MAG TPA: amino acid aminotransferase [Kiritimatiellia bacterium]|nr:amino acid aminotransferase [Kiritimatiellia bacterium]
MFEAVVPAPPDSILGLTEAFNRDSSPEKINLGVGVYKDEEGRTPILAVVKEAEKRVLAKAATKSYMPIGGSPGYRKAVQELLFGADHPLLAAGRVRTLHTPGGTGGLRVGADVLRKVQPKAKVWVSNPTWANHKGIFLAAGFTVEEYAYYDAASKGLDFTNMIEALRMVPAGDVVLLHVCCHNPSGVDLTLDQWREVAEVAGGQGWLPFLDFAYQGFGGGLEADREGLLEMVKVCKECIVASSFSKNFGLYQDRTGAVTFVAGTAEAAEAVGSQAEAAARVNYSNPPAHGGLIVEEILGDAGLAKAWREELDGMRDRIAMVRSQLVDALTSRGVSGDLSFLGAQRGMFSFSGLTDEQVVKLRDTYSIYIVKGGRINVAGITPRNVDRLADAMADVMG